MRKIEIINERVKHSLEKRDVIQKRAEDVITKIEEYSGLMKVLEEEHNTLVSKAVREMEKINSNNEYNDFVKSIEIGEFEDLSKLYLEKEGEDAGKVFMVVADRLQEFKDWFKMEKEKSNEKNNSGDTNEGEGTGDNDPELPAEKPEDDSSIG